VANIADYTERGTSSYGYVKLNLKGLSPVPCTLAIGPWRPALVWSWWHFCLSQDDTTYRRPGL